MVYSITNAVYKQLVARSKKNLQAIINLLITLQQRGLIAVEQV
jgi:hypothetical protein